MVKNINKLKGKITEGEFTMKSLAKALGMSEATIRRKINSKDGEFSVGESWETKQLLNLSMNDYLDIFFGEELELNS